MKRIKANTMMTGCIIISVVCGVLMLTAGWTGPLVFLICFLPFTVVESAVRPFSTAILLNQQEGDTGSASSLINFTHTVLGSIGMILGTLNWGSYIRGLGIILVGSSIISLFIWIIIRKRNMEIKWK